jgi:hypothetical protein
MPEAQPAAQRPPWWRVRRHMWLGLAICALIPAGALWSTVIQFGELHEINAAVQTPPGIIRSAIGATFNAAVCWALWVWSVARAKDDE